MQSVNRIALKMLLCILGFHHKVKIIQKHVFVVFLIHNINSTAEKSSKN